MGAAQAPSSISSRRSRVVARRSNRFLLGSCRGGVVVGAGFPLRLLVCMYYSEAWGMSG